MAGRQFQIVTSPAGVVSVPSRSALARVLRQGVSDAMQERTILRADHDTVLVEENSFQLLTIARAFGRVSESVEKIPHS